jgi:hypothetical protein
MHPEAGAFILVEVDIRNFLSVVTFEVVLEDPHFPLVGVSK